jgi:phospholipase C
MSYPVFLRIGALACVSFFVGMEGCASAGPPVASTAGHAASRNVAMGMSPAGIIKHVVIVVQENRSFENLFAGYPGADAPMYGYNAARHKVPLQSHGFDGTDLPHTWGSALWDWDHGKMDGFSHPSWHQYVGRYPYSFLDRKDAAPYWDIARHYVLADRMFPTMFGVSYTAHLDLIASTATLCCGYSEVNWPSAKPWGCDAPAGTKTDIVNATRDVDTNGPFPCFKEFRTMADTLDAAHVSWKYYAPQIDNPEGGEFWSAFDSIQNVRYGSDWKNVVSPPSRVLSDARLGRLPGVAWVIPDFLDSDHPGIGSNKGPSWVASVVNAIGEGPQWNDTAVVIVWDDWGGWYDDAAPPQLDFRGLGIRVPCLIVSPYVPAGRVSHTLYEFGSILKFVERTFDLPALGSNADGYTDGRSASLEDSFDFTLKPRPFRPIPAPYPRSFFEHRKPSLRPPDDE